MKTYIYARVSKEELNTANQIHVLKEKFPNAEVIEETVSGAKDKPELNKLVSRLEPGDTLVIYALDRIGRSVIQSIPLVAGLIEKGVKLISLREGLDFSTPSGKLVSNIMLGVAQMERELISERTKNALARLKAEGKQLGRPRKISDKKIESIRALRSAGRSIKAISRILKISTGRICQILKTTSEGSQDA